MILDFFAVQTRLHFSSSPLRSVFGATSEAAKYQATLLSIAFPLLITVASTAAFAHTNNCRFSDDTLPVVYRSTGKQMMSWDNGWNVSVKSSEKDSSIAIVNIQNGDTAKKINCDYNVASADEIYFVPRKAEKAVMAVRSHVGSITQMQLINPVNCEELGAPFSAFTVQTIAVGNQFAFSGACDQGIDKINCQPPQIFTLNDDCTVPNAKRRRPASQVVR